MRFVLGFTVLFALLSFGSGNPVLRNSQPPNQVDEEFNDDFPVRPGPNGALPLEQNDRPHENDVKPAADKEDDDMVIMKRRPYETTYWSKSGSTVEIPYTNSGVGTAVLQRAIEVFNAKTCVRFVPRGSQSSYVQFQSGSSCHAAIGMEGGSQPCVLTSNCAANKGKILHEMMHILGFLHEQCRPDRDSYITVHTDRIMSGAEGNFAIISDSRDQGIPYDCDSILHYRAAAFAATTGQNTITSTQCSHLGNDDTRLSLLDYKRVNTLYSCGKPEYKYYKVVVQTDSTTASGSGTDCFIYLTLHGSQQNSTEFELDLSTNPSANLFEVGSLTSSDNYPDIMNISSSTDTFNYMAYRNDLGSITGISVRMVSDGLAPGWWPNTFTVTDTATSTSVTFTSNQWLYPSSTYGTANFPRQ